MEFSLVVLQVIGGREQYFTVKAPYCHVLTFFKFLVNLFINCENTSNFLLLVKMRNDTEAPHFLGGLADGEIAVEKQGV